LRKVTEHVRDRSEEHPGGEHTGPAGAGGEPPPAPGPASTIVDDAMALQAEIQAEQALLESGSPGRATITRFTDTGVLVNFNPQVVLDLSVAVGGRAPYEIQLTTTVPPSHLSRLRAGVDVGVRVDPSEPRRLAIDWSAV
jgi:hypothetical protein